ncbi:MAG: polysaccharide biosynthesis tyrosine autokinase [Gemmatimonadota bacterium]
MIAPPSPATNGRAPREPRLRDVWQFLVRNLWIVIGLPVLVLAAAVLFLTLATPVYEATATLRIDEQRSNVPVLDVLQTLSSGSEINTEMLVLRSRTLAEDVVDSLDLHVDLDAGRGVVRSHLLERLGASRAAPAARYTFERIAPDRFEFSGGPPPARRGEAVVGTPLVLPGLRLTLAAAAGEHESFEVVVIPFQERVEEFRKQLDVKRPEREASLVELTYAGTDRSLVTAVPNVAAGRFIERRNAERSGQARSTVAFLRRQIDTLDTQLVNAEEDLQTFKEEQGVVNLQAAGQAQVEQLADFQAQRELLAAERDALRSLLDAPRSARPESARDVFGFPTLLQYPAVGQLLTSLNELENERAELLRRRSLTDEDVRLLTQRIEAGEAQLEGMVQTYVAGLDQQVAGLDRQLRGFEAELGAIPAKEIRLARLLRQAQAAGDLYDQLQLRLKEAEILAAIDDPTVRMVDDAILPIDPVRPDAPLTLVLAVILGVVLGVGGAAVREHMDNSVHTREELHHATGGLPVLGLIPTIPEAATNGAGRRRVRGGRAAPADLERRLVTHRDPRNPVSEAYRSLRTNLTFVRPDHAPRTVVFTSPAPGEGKSTTSANLAITLAQQGVSCVLVDADLRRGVLHEVFGQAREPGLSQLLLEDGALEETIRRVPLDDGRALDFIPTGTLPPNPAELLGSERMERLLARLIERYEAVFLDAPPMNVVTDAAILGTRADGVVVVARAGVTDLDAMRFTMEQLAAVRAPVLGAVLNGVGTREGRLYGSYANAAYRYTTERY